MSKTMFCEREKVPVLNINQQNDKYTQEYPLYNHNSSGVLETQSNANFSQFSQSRLIETQSHYMIKTKRKSKTFTLHRGSITLEIMRFCGI